MKKVTHFCMLVLLVFIALLIAIYTYLVAFDTPKPIVFSQEESPAWVEGDRLYFSTSFCRYTDAPATINRQFVDGVIFFTPEVVFAGMNEGCYENVVRSIEIPSALPDGEYHVVSTLTYHVNPFAERVVTWRTEEFILDRE